MKTSMKCALPDKKVAKEMISTGKKKSMFTKNVK